MTSSDTTPEHGADILADISARLADLVACTTTFTEINDRLHAENERLRRDETGKLLQPVIRDLIKLADDWRNRGRALRSRDTEAAQEMARLCDELTDDLALVLARLDIEEFTPGTGCAFDRHEHRAVTVQQTGSRELDGIVVDTRRPGYRSGEKIVRFAEVIVAKFVSLEDDRAGDVPGDQRDDAQHSDDQGKQ